MRHFDRVFCINLDRQSDRWADARAEFKLCGINDYVRVSGVDDPVNGAGCTASHKSLWRRIAAGGEGERVLIFEDDFKFLTRTDLMEAGYSTESDVMKIFESCSGVTFADRFEVLESYIPETWDLLYLGGGYQTFENNFRISRHVIRTAGMLCLHAYGISREYANRITASLGQYDTEWPTDTILACEAKRADVVAYTLSPRLFIQRQSVGFPYSMTDPVHELAAQ